MTEFTLSKSEEEKARVFRIKHVKTCRHETAIGGLFQYIFTPTSIGQAVEIKCVGCKKTKDLTDYKTW